jgi:hypothetical protein
MPIGFRIAPDDEWASHIENVRTAQSTACYGALAAHFGTDSPKILERRVDEHRPRDQIDFTNKYRRWREGSAPNKVSVAHIHARTAGAVRLDFWRDLPLWELLAPQSPPMPRLLRLLENASPNVRRILLRDGCGVQQGRFNHSPPTRAQLLAIRNLRSLDAFIALLCLARKGEQMEDDTQHFLPSACAYDIFARILYTYRPLRYRREGLFACIERLYWNRVYMNGLYVDFPIEAIRLNLTQLDANPSTPLAEKSGRRLRRSSNDSMFEQD